MSAGEIVELTVTGFANGGEGVGREEPGGRAVFVAGALPGERVRVRLTESRPRYARGELTEVVEASPDRVASQCPAAAAGAGCCDLAEIAPRAARRLKSGALADVLARIGGLDLTALAAPDVRLLGDDDQAGWRVRTRLAVDAHGNVGLRARGSSAVVTQPCVGPDPALLLDVAELGAAPGTELVLAVDSAGARHAVELGRVAGEAGGRGRRGAQSARARRARPRPERRLDGEDFARQNVGGRTWEVPVTGFWQAHHAAPSAYAETVADFAGAVLGDTDGWRVWDLYGGVGTLGAALLDRAASVDLVETDAGALVSAERALSDAPVTCRRGDVATVVSRLSRPDVVIADPPRRGAGADVVAAIAAAEPRAVVQVGCDAASFARDLRDWSSHGYRVIDWRAFDAFPLTHHVEAIAVLASP